MKLYSRERGHDEIGNLSNLVISCLARVEVPAAIWRKSRGGELDAADAAVLTADFEADYYGDEASLARFLVLAVPETILADAAEAAATRGLRAYDAIQLASARAARKADPACYSFACYDKELRAVAAADGFSLIPT